MDSQPISILVVDDNHADVSVVRSLLDYRWDGRFQLFHVEELPAALDCIARQRIDVVLLSLTLRDSDAMTTFFRLNENSPELPIVVLGGLNDKQLATRAMQGGAQDFLVKSELDDNMLVRSIRYAIERARRTSAEEALRAAAARLGVAREIQQGLFPASPPNLPGFDIAGISRPAEETGGDYYDFMTMRDGCLGIVVADVSNHGLGSALLMAETRAYLRAFALTHCDVGEILTQANRILAEDTGGSHFVTLLLARLDPNTRSLIYAGAGHEGYVFEPDGEARLLESTSLPLAVDGETVVPVAPEFTLQPGQTLVVYTDGIQESETPGRELFGVERTLQTVRDNLHASAQSIVESLYDAARRHAAGTAQSDDITAVAVKVL